MLLLLQSFTPGDCLLTGLCGAGQNVSAVPSGVLFLALGMVLAGGVGLIRSRRRS